MSKARELAELSRTVSDSADAVAITIDSSEDVSFSEDIKLGDGKKAIFGASSDLSIYHDGSASFISDQGTGHLKILAGDFRVNNAADNAQFISAVNGAEVNLYHNNALKLATTSTGITVGNGSGSQQIYVDAGAGWADLKLNSDATNGGSIYFNDGADAGQIWYYHPDNTMRFHTDGSERMRISGGNVGVNTSAVRSTVHIKAANNNWESGLLIENNSGNKGWNFHPETNGELLIGYNTATNASLTDQTASLVMKLDTSGAVTKTNQPAFLVTKNANQNNIAANTDVVVTWTTEVFDVGSNFNTSTNVFDAPVSGKYQLSSNIRIDNIDSSANYYIVSIFTSNRLFRAVYSLNTLSADPVYWAFTLSITADMDAGDHAWVTVNQGGGSVQADIAGDVSYTQFSGYLLG